MAGLSIDERLKSLLAVKESDPRAQKAFSEAKTLYEKFENARSYQDAMKASNDLVGHIKQFHYQDMRPTTPSDDLKKKEEVAALENFLEAEMKRRFEMMAEFLREQERQEAEQRFYEEKIEKKELEELIKLSYELARVIEEQKKKAEYEQLMYPSDNKPLYLSNEERHEAIYSEIRDKVNETIEDIFRRFGVDRPLTQEESEMYEKVHELYKAYENEKDSEKAEYLVDQLVNLCKIYNYSHYDEYGQKDKKDPAFFAQMAEELKTIKREELSSSSSSSGFGFLKALENLSDRLNKVIHDLTNKEKEEDINQRRPYQLRPEPPKE